MTTRFRSQPFCAALGIALFALSTGASATVHRVFPGESIQATIDAAAPGDTILVEPGTYKGTDSKYGLRITTDNIRLIGKSSSGKGVQGRVRLVATGKQETGVYAAPTGCDYRVSADSELGKECATRKVQNFYIRGFSVEGFPVNGIQTRWVDGFEFVGNHSVNNLNNGIYPTLSLNGLVQNNVSYGSLDTAMWVAASENVRVIGNDLSKSTIGFEITVSNNVWFTQNKVHGNTLGIGLFHPNAAGNPPMETMANWVIEHNDVRDNNLPNPAVDGTFQKELPPGIGILLLGVSDHVIAKNTVEGNDYVGIGVLGWCTANQANPQRCAPGVLLGDPSVNNNLVSLNKLSGNATLPPELWPLPLPSVDILYVQVEGGTGNCFEKNKWSGFTFYSSTAPPSPEPLPTDGCKAMGL